jgi:hypothetical protein
MIKLSVADQERLRAAINEMGEAGQVRLGLRLALLQWRDRLISFAVGIGAGWWLF